MKTFLIIAYLLCVVVMFATYIHLSKKAKENSGRPWYLLVLLIAFAPVTFIAAIVIGVKEEYKHRCSPQYKEQQQWLREKKRKERRRKSVLALYNRRYAHRLTEVPASFIHTAHSLHSAMDAEQYTSILSHLDRLSLPNGENLFVRLPSSKHGCGDASRLYIAPSIYGQEREFPFLSLEEIKEPAPLDLRKYKIFRHIRVEDSIEGAWQALLLSQLWHVLPFYWHGEYDTRRYILTRDDLEQLLSAPRTDRRKLTFSSNDYNVAPECVDAGQGIYYLSWCYWTEWGGLIRETYQVSIREGKADILYLHNETLHRYDCGWML